MGKINSSFSFDEINNRLLQNCSQEHITYSPFKPYSNSMIQLIKHKNNKFEFVFLTPNKATGTMTIPYTSLICTLKPAGSNNTVIKYRPSKYKLWIQFVKLPLIIFIVALLISSFDEMYLITDNLNGIIPIFLLSLLPIIIPNKKEYAQLKEELLSLTSESGTNNNS